MKTILLCCFSLFLLASCQSDPKGRTSANVDEVADKDTIPEATGIYWVDKAKRVSKDPLAIRTVKAKVLVHEDGKVDLHSFVKEQPGHVERYLRYRLEIFRVQKVMLDSGFVKPGEQYVQLRYQKKEAKGFK